MKIIISLIIGIVTLGYIATLPRTVVYRINDPSGKYTAIISYKSYLSLIPMPPGSSSDKPCYVKIIDKNNNNYGEISVDMIQNAVIDWGRTVLKSLLRENGILKIKRVITGRMMVTLEFM